MLTNLMHGADVTASAGTMQFQIQFDTTINEILRMNRLTGQSEILTLNNHVLSLTLEGGTGDLFKYSMDNTSEIVPGDANADGRVNVSDLSLLAANYGTTSGATWGTGDFTGDGAVNVSDLSLLAANYGTGSSDTLSWADAYAQAFGTTEEKETSADENIGSVCSMPGLSLVAGLVLMGGMLVRLEEQETH
jgi:hypothetical protein